MADPEGHDDGVSDFLRRFEDRNEPVTAEAARAEFEGRLPEPMPDWHAAQGAEV